VTQLYSLTGHYAALMELAESGEDVSTELDRINDAIADKGAALCKVIANLEADAAAFAAEEERLGARKRAAEAQVKRLREYIRCHMQQAGITKIKGPQFTITLSGGQERVEIVNLDDVEPQYIREKTTREADRRALLKQYKDTGEIPSGCEIHETTTLRIR
jgi:hypothetical protein